MSRTRPDDDVPLPASAAHADAAEADAAEADPAPADPAPADPAPADAVSLREATGVWWRIALQTFGGPAGQIAVMQRTLVEERRWLGRQRFTHALSFCMLLPGPEAQQLATYTGWLLNGTAGALVAGGLFVLPGVVVLLVVSALYVTLGDTGPVEAVFAGIAPAVLAIVVQAVWRLGRRGLHHPALQAVAAAAFACLALLGVPFPVVIVAAAAMGLLLGRVAPASVVDRRPDDADAGPPPLVPDDALHGARPSWRSALRVLAVGVPLWLAPVAAAAVLLGRSHAVAEQGRFFAGSALVTFGGAYAVLSFVAQRAVETYHWVTPKDMLRGLGLAETTPGPLIMVVQFVAFVGAYRQPGSLAPWVAALAAALLTTWVTFVPSFVFILLGAPFVESLRGNRSVASALAGVSAAIVGVIANLGVYFAVHTLFGAVREHRAGPLRVTLPDPGSLQPVAVGIALLTAWLLLGRGWSVLRVIGAGAAVGLATAGASALWA